MRFTGLKRLMTLLQHHLHLIPELLQAFLLPVIATGGVAGHLIAVAAEEPVERQLCGLAQQVPTGQVHGGGQANHGLPRPATLGGLLGSRVLEELPAGKIGV